MPFEWPTERHEPASDPVCSARGCRESARWALRWNNPRLHTPNRRKTWLACSAHRESLSSHLGARGFLRETDDLASTVHLPVAPVVEAVAPPPLAPTF